MKSHKIINTKLQKNLKKNIVFLTFGLAMFSFVVYLLIISLVETDLDFDMLVFLLSWAGILIFTYIVFTHNKLTGCVFSPYTIFVLFYFLFNFGQPLMWSIGIHQPREIGQAYLYSGLDVATEYDIVKAQALILVSIIMFHFGAIISCKCYEADFATIKSQQNGEDRVTLKLVYYICLLISIVAIPVTLYFTYSDLQIARTYGYSALYYSEYARKEAGIYTMFMFMFFPCLVGLLIGSKFKKNIRLIVSIVFVVYLLLNLLAGDRGSWIYKLIILIWMSHAMYKPLNFKKIIKYISVSLIGLYLLDAIVSLRNKGITFESVKNSLSFEHSPIISAIFEMGNSMAPTIVLQKYGWDVWPYLNSYLLALLGMITNKVIYFFNIPFQTISSWFSQGYLGISWGAGFSIVSEALLNFGPVFAPLFMILLGYLMSSFINIDKNMHFKEVPLRYLFAVSSLHAFIRVNRNFFHLLLKEWFYGVLILCTSIFVIRAFVLKKRS